LLKAKKNLGKKKALSIKKLSNANIVLATNSIKSDISNKKKLDRIKYVDGV
jgi:hypothetical protein